MKNGAASPTLIALMWGLAVLLVLGGVGCESPEVEHGAIDASSACEGHDHAARADEAAESAIRMSDRDRLAAGIELATADAGPLMIMTELLGEVRVNEERLAHVVPPVPGIVREVNVHMGDNVEVGTLLAVLASRELAEARAEYLSTRGRWNLAVIAHDRERELWEREILAEQDYLNAKQALSEAEIEFQTAEQALHALGADEAALGALLVGHEVGALTRYELRAPIGGVIIDLHLVLGEVVGDESEVLTVADLSTVWVDLDVPQVDLGSVREQQSVTISTSGTDAADITDTIDFVSPVIDDETRTALARVEIPNTNGQWRPGLFVSAYVVSERLNAPILIPRHAVQMLEGETVVFVPIGDAFESRPVLLGQFDATHVEIESGLRQGESYVVEGAFALKAEMVTSGLDPHAGHGH